ncbi:TPA: hypothetical protein F8S49_11365 [Legionella pneumophila]|nr:hypothetical protein [Legionella pneumophila]HAU1496587.1 hypothetical protein [Legionella pneumophila]
MTLDEFVNKIKYHDFWYKESFAKILSACNSEVGDEKYFNNILSAAHKAQILKPMTLNEFEMFYPALDKSPWFPVDTLNFKYSPQALVDWATKKNFNLPNELCEPYRVIKTNDDQLSDSERVSLYKMILAMAKEKYDYDPKKSRNNATGGNKYSIKAGAERLGYAIDEDTIRTHLLNAHKTLDG